MHVDNRRVDHLRDTADCHALYDRSKGYGDHRSSGRAMEHWAEEQKMLLGTRRSFTRLVL
jgi:hypothetical protein